MRFLSPDVGLDDSAEFAFWSCNLGDTGRDILVGSMFSSENFAEWGLDDFAELGFSLSKLLDIGPYPGLSFVN